MLMSLILKMKFEISLKLETDFFQFKKEKRNTSPIENILSKKNSKTIFGQEPTKAKNMEGIKGMLSQSYYFHFNDLRKSNLNDK